MKKSIYYIIFIVLLAACKSKQFEKPILLHNSTIVFMPFDSLAFQTPIKGWKAELVSFIQPIPLSIGYTQNGFYIKQKTSTGVIEGSAQICLSKEKTYFYYPISIYNKQIPHFTKVEYRSPKTVNPDSSLVQQKIKHNIDYWRNLKKDSVTNKFFFEEIIVLNPKAGTYRAQEDKSLSSFYIQPGSCIQIPVTMNYNRAENSYKLIAGPLKDKHNNMVADGTKAAFIYTDGITNYRMESSSLNGFATTSIPAETGEEISLVVHINETVSSTIKLVHK
jgi:hypothetical protein